MKFFVDTADKNKIMELISLGMVDGVTTNPSLIAKNGDDMVETITAICLDPSSGNNYFYRPFTQTIRGDRGWKR